MRLRRLIGARRFLAIAPFLNAEDIKVILSLALTLKLLRDHDPTKQAITNLTSELCSIKDPATAYQAVERIMIKFIFGTPGFIMGVYQELVKELTGLRKSTGGGSSSTSQPSTQTPRRKEPVEPEGFNESKVVVRNFKGNGASHVYSDRKSTNLGKNPFQSSKSSNTENSYSGPVKISKAFKSSK